nr:MAG TPA: hypothetical protein [Bacteriophage sp.]
MERKAILFNVNFILLIGGKSMNCSFNYSY